VETSLQTNSCGGRGGRGGTQPAAATGRDGAGYFKKSLEHFLPAELAARYEFVEQESANYEVKDLCEAVGVDRSSYYRSRRRGEQQEKEVPDAAAVAKVFWRHSRRYGSRRIEAELKAEGVAMGRHRIRRLMHEQGLRAIQPRSFVPRTTDSRHHLGYCENILLAMDVPPRKPNEVLVGDITYLPLQGGGFCYLATWTDLFSRLIVGWEVQETMAEELIITAFEKAVHRRTKLAGAIVHSDRGGQYASSKFRQMLKQAGCRQSMSRAGESYDNAFAESLFSRYKAELLEGGAFSDVAEARLETFNYIEGYYNRIRRHSSLGYMSPEEYERKYVAARDHKLSEILDKKPVKGILAKTLLCRTF
jgi:transposase InsO family protein